jgi:DNA polymerase III subunit epsilon
LEKSIGACFHYQLKKCKGACAGQETTEAYNKRLLLAFERQRIQSWPFKEAVLLQEKTVSEASHGIIVDKWCVLGEVEQEPYCEPKIKLNQKAFDLDTYKILQSFLSTKAKKLTARPFPLNEIQKLSEAY